MLILCVFMLSKMCIPLLFPLKVLLRSAGHFDIVGNSKWLGIAACSALNHGPSS